MILSLRLYYGLWIKRGNDHRKVGEDIVLHSDKETAKVFQLSVWLHQLPALQQYPLQLCLKLRGWLIASWMLLMLLGAQLFFSYTVLWLIGLVGIGMQIMQIFTLARPSRCHSCNRRNKLQLWHLCRQCLHMFLPLVWTGHLACQQLSFQCFAWLASAFLNVGSWEAMSGMWMFVNGVLVIANTSLSGWVRIQISSNFKISIPSRTTCHCPRPDPGCPSPLESLASYGQRA